MKGINGKVCIVTGTTSGIGKETAKELAKMGATTIMVARDLDRGRIALEDVIEYSGNENVDLFLCDFSSQSSIITFANDFKKKYSRLDILVNNAGMMSEKRVLTGRGIELTFAINHLGYFLTTNLLLDILKDNLSSRIVVVASDAHFNGSIDLDDLMHENYYRGFNTYCDTKLANILFTYKLANDLKGSKVTINALHPGVIKTKFSVKDRNSHGTFPMGIITPEDGAKAQIYLSTSDEVEGVTGMYFNQKRAERSSAASYNTDLADNLWHKSLELTQQPLSI